MAAQPTVVIVVDDNAGFLKAVARLLALNGIESRTFASAEALLESGSAQTATVCCSTSCACRKLNPGILVMQSAQGWATKNVPGAIDGGSDPGCARSGVGLGVVAGSPILIGAGARSDAMADIRISIKRFPLKKCFSLFLE